MTRKHQAAVVVMWVAAMGLVTAASAQATLTFDDAGINMGGNNITNLPTTITSSDHALSLGAANGRFVDRTGDSMTGNLDMIANNILNVGALSVGMPTTPQQLNLNETDGDGVVANINGFDNGATPVAGSAMLQFDDASDTGQYRLGFTSTGAGALSLVDLELTSPGNPHVMWSADDAGNLVLPQGADANGNNITNLPTISSGVGSDHAVSFGAGDSRYLQRSGDSMTGDLDMGGNDILNCGNCNFSGGGGGGNQTLADVLNEGNSAGTNNISMNGNRIVNLEQPSFSSQASGEALAVGTASDHFVARQGDTMTGNLDMQDNQVQNILQAGFNHGSFIFEDSTDGNALNVDATTDLILEDDTGVVVDASGNGASITASTLTLLGRSTIDSVNMTDYDDFGTAGTDLTCNNANEGKIQYNGTHHIGCDGSAWRIMYR